MPSLGAHAAKLLLRATVKLPMSFAIRGGFAVAAERRVMKSGEMTFARLPRGTRRIGVGADAFGAAGEWIVPAARPDSPLVLYYLHGGGYVAGSPAGYRSLTGTLALRCDARLFAIDYRLAPEHPFPCGLEDATRGYDWLRTQGVASDRIVVVGDSAGGGLALSLLLALRDSQRPLPAAAVLFSPWVDLAGTTDSIRTNAARDDAIVIDEKRTLAQAYAGKRPLDDPAISGVYADLRGLPPLLVQASESEVLRDEATLLVDRARAAGVDATLQLWEDLPHVWQVFARLPESRDALAKVATFVDRITHAQPKSA